MLPPKATAPLPVNTALTFPPPSEINTLQLDVCINVPTLLPRTTLPLPVMHLPALKPIARLQVPTMLHINALKPIATLADVPVEKQPASVPIATLQPP